VSGPEEGLSIGELAQRAGVPAATLRSWEDRHGFPRPRRLAGGHRRYQDSDVALIGEVLRLRASGLSLQAAIGQAAARAEDTEPSVFAGLRRRHPALAPQELRKATVLALTRAIEDECCAQAGQAALFRPGASGGAADCRAPDSAGHPVRAHPAADRPRPAAP
jgi:MerR family transcriptional regulator, light-induced transcriptional regulator